MDKLKMETPDLTQSNIEKLATLFPACVTETQGEDGKLKKAVNFELLRQMLTDVVLEGDEAYEFTWVGKKAAIMEANRPIRKTLRPCPAESVNWDSTENLYIEGDNLEVLKLLQESYLGKVKMIFIDPPYNTGSDAFVYNDRYTMSEEEMEDLTEYRDEEGNIRFVQNNSANPRFHSNWLSMIYQRLMLGRNLLSDDGAIFITIDHNEHAGLKLVCDEVFGLSCFIGDLVWKSSDNSNNNALTFSEDHNYILVYSKRPDWKPNFLNDPKKRSHFKNPDNDPKGPWFDGNPVNNPGLRVNLQYDITTPSGKIIHHPANGWRWSWETVQEKLKTGELRFSEDETRLIRRTYLCDMEGLPPSTLCVDIDVTGHTRGAKYELKKLFPEIPVTSLFSTPKPTLLLKYLLSIGSNQNSLILDFFSGSASTAEAVMQYNNEDSGNRRFIMIQVPEPCEKDKSGYQPPFKTICEMGKERIRRAARKIAADNPGKTFDGGFRVFKLDDTNMTDVYYSAGEYDQGMLDQLVSNIKPD
ncbi:MAG: site-specific DNA-methyltransferase, partial [Lachnospiraceae bacterium]|nr:site-specific DNA-methyltransferase [Lachnospiraceae bacterium]